MRECLCIEMFVWFGGRDIISKGWVLLKNKIFLKLFYYESNSLMKLIKSSYKRVKNLIKGVSDSYE